jgi:hypothetical protein
LYKNTFWAIFITNSSGHPGSDHRNPSIRILGECILHAGRSNWPKIMVLASADMAVLTLFIISLKIEVNNLVSQLMLTFYYDFALVGLQEKSSYF